jgi:hypothetical protein
MKTRKVFLKGYIELHPALFKGRNPNRKFISINKKGNVLTISEGTLNALTNKPKVGDKVNARIGIHETENRFAIMFCEDGEFNTRKYKSGGARLVGKEMISKLVERGFECGKRYDVVIEDDVVFVGLEEAV